MPKTISLDFDGVIHSYASGWQGPRTITDPPVPGAIDFLLQLIADGWDVAIFSTRSTQWGGRRAMKRWLRFHAAMHWEDELNAHVRDHTRQDLWLQAGHSPGMDSVEEEADDAGRWLVRQIRWPSRKPPAFVGLDDRVIQFTGHFPSTGELAAFKPWNRG